jgi:hypothetical protein
MDDGRANHKKSEEMMAKEEFTPEQGREIVCRLDVQFPSD